MEKMRKENVYIRGDITRCKRMQVVVVVLLLPSVVSHLITHDYCVLGAGPGGLQIAKFLEEAGRDYVVFERSQGPGSFFHHFPRHRKLISINKRFTGRTNKEFNFRHDWNSLLSQDELRFFHYSQDFFPHADDMVKYLQNFSSALSVHYSKEIRHVRLKSNQDAWHGHYFVLEDETEQEHMCNVLLVATGLSLANKLKFPGEEYVEGYETISIDPSNFTGQSVLILGRGNSAFETAQNILSSTNFIHMIGRSRVRLSWSTHYVGDLRSVKLTPSSGLKKKYPLLKPNYEAKHVNGLFVVGTASHGVDFRKSAGGFIHGFRYTARSVHRIMEKRYHNIPWPSSHYSVSQLLNVLLRRINEASGLYQMFDVLVDVILLGKDSTTFEHLEEIPVGTIPTVDKSTGRKVYDTGVLILIMEYGKNFSGPDKDVFHYNRAIGDEKAAWRSNFLHPVIYYYRQLPSEQQMELRPQGWPLPRPDNIHHVVEDFLTDWTGPNSHILPFRRFLENCLQKDLRTFYPDSCFAFLLTHQKLPFFCQQVYLQNQGQKGKEELRNYTHLGFRMKKKREVDVLYSQTNRKDEF
ncbi:FAD-dependent oxidoreductase domain-containing protein 2 isoform X4 [Bufo gargarizans]|uniref:FAD-dependent oxidoreductase domain-containing protein 2 isoform X4 n=1 Tax=Bufo gargarizans TaxID=30331 RepID=UPI001CF45724|nr:FAD-dependent oxidoreductase domain-containing protein 2 isoform X4 [Bufo gargarizans]